MHRKGFCTLDPCLPDTYRKHPYVHCDATIRVFVFFDAVPHFIGVRHEIGPFVCIKNRYLEILHVFCVAVFYRENRVSDAHFLRM